MNDERKTINLSFFDANAHFGCGIRAIPEFATPKERLAHMDRLGIEHALVWHLAARDMDPVWGNHRLIEDLNAAKVRKRLIPSFVIAPTMLYRPGVIRDLKRAMQREQVRALRIFPTSLRHTLPQVEPVIRALAPLKPVLFLDSRDGVNPAELLALAKTFPHMSMVYMQVMWGGVISLLDLMRRRKNILADTSWLHTTGTIEQIVKEFDAERLVFGTGFKAHNGASMAGLAYADITPRERALIAHENLERLLRLPRAGNAAQRSALPDRRKAVWAKFMAGQKLPFDIVDAHFHLGLIGIWPLSWRDDAEQMAYALRRMDRVNIAQAVVSGGEALFSEPVAGNRALEKLAQTGANRFAGYLGFNPHYDRALLSRLDEFFSGKFFIGFKLLCDYQGVPVTDPRFKPVWDYAHRHRLPILLHTWEGACNSPRLLKDIVPAHPQATFILGHSGGGNVGRREAIALAKANSNVFLEFCGSFTSDIAWEETIAEVGADQIVFGTDGIYHDPAWELGRLVSLDIDEKTMAKFLGGNMRAILARRK